MPLSGASEALVRRWLDRPENRAEWERLRTALSLAEGFQFFALQVSDPIGELFLEMLLRAEAEDGGVELAGFDLLRPPEGGPLLSSLLRVLEGAPRPSWFYFQGSSFFRETRPAAGDFFLYLNQKRDVVAQTGGVPLLLSLPSEGWSLFRQAAPDFWSIHTSVYRFGSAEVRREERVREASEEAFVWQTFVSFVALRFLRTVLPSLIRRKHAESTPPPAVPDGLIGRESEKRTLRTWLAQPGARIFVQGRPGVGKTSLLREVTADITRIFPDGIFYFSLSDGGKASRIMEEVVEALRPGLLVPLQGRAVLQAMFQDVTAEKKILLILDGVEDLDALEELVPSPPSAVLAVGQIGPTPEGWRRLVVDAPRRRGQADVKELIPPGPRPGGTTTKRSDGPATAEAVRQEALALVQEGDLDDARERFDSARALARESGRPDLEALVLRDQTAFALWRGQVDATKGLAQDVLRLNPTGQVRGDLIILAIVSAVSLGEEMQIQELIPLVEGAESTISPALRLLVGCTTLARFAEEGELPKIQSDLEVALDVRMDPMKDLGVRAWVMALRGEVHRRQKELGPARASAGSALRHAREAYDWEAEAEALRVMGRIYEEAGDFVGAEASFRELLELREKMYSKDHEGVAWAAHDLARLLRKMGRYKEAEDFYLRAVAIFQRGRPATDGALTRVLFELGNVLRRLGRFSEAEAILREDLAVALGSLGPAHLQSANILAMLALVALQTRRLEEAEELARSSLALQEHSPMFRTQLGRRLLADTLSLLAQTLAARGEVTEALAVLRALQLPVYEELDDPHGRAETLGEIAELLASQERYDEALPLARERLSLLEQLGDVRGRAVALGEIANLFAAQNRYDEALPLFREQLALFERLGDTAAAENVREILQAHEPDPS